MSKVSPPEAAGPVDPPGLPDFERYALIIDARSPHEFAEDHIPGAVNLPVADDAEFAEVGIAYKADPHQAYVVGAQFALRNIAEHVRTVISRYPHDARFLVYCFRGGKRSRAWAEPLKGIGYSVDVLPGGWKSYRRQVVQALATLPARFEYRVLAGKTGSGKTRLLQALQAAGQQVLDLEGLAVHKGSLLGLLPGDVQPTQKLFDGELLRTMSAFDPARPVWVEAESKKVGNLQLPDSLMEAMQRSLRIEVSVPLAERVQLLREEYPHLVQEPQGVLQRLAPLKAMVGKKELEHWEQLVDAGDVDGLIERLLQSHYDPSYTRSGQRALEAGRSHAPEVVEFAIDSLRPEALEHSVRTLVERFGSRA